MYSEYTGASPFSRSGYESYADSSIYPQGNSSSANAPIEAPDSFIKSGTWLESELLVRVLPTYEDSSVHRMTGTVMDVNKGARTCHIYFEDLEVSGGNAERENIPFEFLVPVVPERDEQVIFLK